MSRDESPSASISIVDVLLVAFGLFLIGLSISNLQAGHPLTAASDLAFGIAGLSVGLRQTMERILNRELMIMNRIALAGAIFGFILIAIEIIS